MSPYGSDFGYLDTGAMYRAVTWLVLRDGLPLDELSANEDRLSALLASSPLDIRTDPADRAVAIAGQDVTEVIRGDEVTSAVSAVAATPAVRAHLSGLQRRLALAAVAGSGGIVVEGRDIGTAIFPDARLKVWLTASAEARGRRRAAEHSDNAQPAQTTVEAVVEDLARRDELDSTRKASPLHCAPDAHVVDTTTMSADEVIKAVVDLWQVVELPIETAGQQNDSTPQKSTLQDSSTGAAR